MLFFNNIHQKKASRHYNLDAFCSLLLFGLLYKFFCNFATTYHDVKTIDR